MLNIVQVPGVIVMEVASSDAGTADPGLARILTVFNASTKAYTGDWPQQARSLQVPRCLIPVGFSWHAVCTPV